MYLLHYQAKGVIRGNTFIVDWDIMRVISYVDRRGQTPRVRSVEYNSEGFTLYGNAERERLAGVIRTSPTVECCIG